VRVIVIIIVDNQRYVNASRSLGLDEHRIFIYHAGENRLDPPWRLMPDAGTQD